MVRHRRAKLAALAASAVFGALGGVAVAASTNSLPFAADHGQTTAATCPSPAWTAPTPPGTAASASPAAATPSPASELARRTATVRMRPDPRSTDSAPRTQPGRAPRMGTGPTRPRSRRWHQPPVAPTTSPPSVPTRPRRRKLAVGRWTVGRGEQSGGRARQSGQRRARDPSRPRDPGPGPEPPTLTPVDPRPS